MTYQKPTLLVEPAFEVVKGSQTKDSHVLDSPVSISSAAAYEADE